MGTEDRLKTILTAISQVADEQKRYAYRTIIPLGKITFIAGDPGTCKTKFALHIAASITRGFPLHSIPCGAVGNVLMFSTEDDASDLKKTFLASGGDPDKLFVLSETVEALTTLTRTPITFQSPIIEEAIKATKPQLVIFDPYQRYVGKADMNGASETNAALAPLTILGKKYGCAFLIVAHHNKNTSSSLLHRLTGSIDAVGNARSVLSIVRDPKQPDEIIAIHTKTNNQRSKSIRYRVVPIKGDEDFAKVEILSLEDYTETDYRKALKWQEAKEFEKEIDEYDPIVMAIKGLVADNPDGVRLRKDDFHMAVEKYTDKGISDSIDSIIKRYRYYLADKHGILIDGRTSQILRAFKIKGETCLPSKSPDRNIFIRKLTPHTPVPPQ